MLDWPPKGADMNPIENIWSLLVFGVSGLSRLFGIPTNADQLFEYAEAIWMHIRDQNLHLILCICIKLISKTLVFFKS